MVDIKIPTLPEINKNPPNKNNKVIISILILLVCLGVGILMYIERSSHIVDSKAHSHIKRVKDLSKREHMDLIKQVLVEITKEDLRNACYTPELKAVFSLVIEEKSYDQYCDCFINLGLAQMKDEDYYLLLLNTPEAKAKNRKIGKDIGYMASKQCLNIYQK